MRASSSYYVICFTTLRRRSDYNQLPHWKKFMKYVSISQEMIRIRFTEFVPCLPSLYLSLRPIGNLSSWYQGSNHRHARFVSPIHRPSLTSASTISSSFLDSLHLFLLTHTHTATSTENNKIGTKEKSGLMSDLKSLYCQKSADVVWSAPLIRRSFFFVSWFFGGSKGFYFLRWKQ